MISSEQKKKSLRACWREGIFSAVMQAILDYYILPFALMLNASAQAIGFLVAGPHLIASVSQLLSVRIVRWVGSRRKLILQSAFLQSLLIFFMGLLAFTQNYGLSIVILAALLTAVRILGNFIMTAWGSLVSEYLAPEERGAFLGGRSQAAGIAGLIGMTMAGMLLYFAKKNHFSELGFFIVFCLAAVSRLFSGYWISQMSPVKRDKTPGSDFTFYNFIRQFRSSNFVKFVIFTAAMTFATQIASPFFTVYLIRERHFSYLAYMFIFVSHVIGCLIAFPLWGTRADMVGNAKILKVTSFLIPVVPLLWIFAKDPITFALIELFGGFAWGGYNLCAVNFIYDAVRPEKRVRCLAYFNLINGVAFFAGASLGGILAERLPAVLGSRLITLFIISAGLRMGAHFLTGKFREVRHYHEQIRSVDLFFSVVGLKPLNPRPRV